MKYVTCLHGNEIIPLLALADADIGQVVGNPLAVEKGVRFIDTDLNASFGLAGSGYEVNRAQFLLNKIPESETIVDFHTTSAVTDPFVIIVDLGQLELARKTGIKHVVYMKYSPKSGHALLNHRSGISVEVGAHQSPESYDNTLRVVASIRQGGQFPVTLYEVYDKISHAGKYSNFVEHQEGFVPVLAGSTAYQSFGFKSRVLKY